MTPEELPNKAGEPFPAIPREGWLWSLTWETPGWTEPAPMRYVNIPAQRAWWTSGNPSDWSGDDITVITPAIRILNVEDLKRAAALLCDEPAGTV